MTKYFLEMTNISKSFPGVKALDNASIKVMEGEVHALMGENGAGKSTFVKILNGLLQPDQGEIYLNGEKVRVEGPSHALQLGIAMIYQELNPVKDMTVAENIFLGKEIVFGHSCFVDKKACIKEAERLLKEFGLNIDPRIFMRDLSIAQMQMIEIMKAVSSGAKLIVMDEPTSSLTDDEIKILFQKIHELKEKKVSIIYISHRMEEIFEITEAVTIFRDGQYIATHKTSEIEKNKLISLMVGRELDSVFPKTFVEIKEPVLQVKNLQNEISNDISFEVRAGEILGFYGLVGAGRSEVFRTIFGLDKMSAGEITLHGKKMEIKHPYDAIEAGIAMVTEDRKEFGLVLCRSIKENIALTNMKEFAGRVFIDKAKELTACNDITSKITLKMSGLQQLAGNLSGGNQQKVVLSKWLLKNPKVLILDEPTRGIDVGAKAEIHSLMCEFAKAGMAIVLISSELPEVMGMSDRMIIMGEGKIHGEMKREEYSQNKILKYALGGKGNE